MSLNCNADNENRQKELNDWDQDDWAWNEEETIEQNSAGTNSPREKAAEQKKNAPNEPANWRNWKPWGNILSTATEGLGNITTTVSYGLLGVPDPEELARVNAKIEVSSGTDELEKTVVTDEHNVSDASQNAFGLNLVTGLGAKVLNTGLDTLEGIGKKTMNILQEQNLMKKRNMLGIESDRPNLSEILKEAKAGADQLEDTLQALKIEKSKQQLCFDVLFENNCGLVHLEALELLSNESSLRLQKLLSGVSGQALVELQETLNEVKELMELDNLEVSETDGFYTADELSSKLYCAIEDSDFQIKFDEIVSSWDSSLKWLEAADTADEGEVFAHAITALAENCAQAVNKLHKIGELLLVREIHSTANEIDSVVQLCEQFLNHLNGLTNRFASVLAKKDSEVAQNFAGTIFAELVLAVQQIEKSFKFFVPILQIGAV